jgi:RNA polymerase sigma-70 factor (ECF subfamily)
MTSATVAAPIDSAESLLARAVGGSEAAFAQIVERHHRDLVRVGFVACGDQDVAEEAAAAAWAIAWRRLRDVREPERLGAWLCSVAVNEARQILRRRNRRSVREIDLVDTEPSRRSDPAERASDLDLANAMARLSPEDRALVALRYIGGLNSSELGRALGISASGTRVRLARLLTRLREDLGDG